MSAPGLLPERGVSRAPSGPWPAGAGHGLGLERVLGPGVFGVAAPQLLAHLRITPGPEARQVLGDLHRAARRARAGGASPGLGPGRWRGSPGSRRAPGAGPPAPAQGPAGSPGGGASPPGWSGSRGPSRRAGSAGPSPGDPRGSGRAAGPVPPRDRACPGARGRASRGDLGAGPRPRGPARHPRRPGPGPGRPGPGSGAPRLSQLRACSNRRSIWSNRRSSVRAESVRVVGWESRTRAPSRVSRRAVTDSRSESQVTTSSIRMRAAKV